MSASSYFRRDIPVEIPFTGEFSHTEDDCCCGFTVYVKNGQKTHRVKFVRDWGIASGDGITMCVLVGPFWGIYNCCEHMRQTCKDNADSTHQVHSLCGVNDFESAATVNGVFNIFMKGDYIAGSQAVYQLKVADTPPIQNMK